MPLPKKNPDENEKNFIDRCMGDETMQSEYPDKDQRYAICQKQTSASGGAEPDPQGKPELVMYGIIGEDIQARDVQDWLAQNLHAPEIVIRMSSDGGSVFDGLTIMNAIARHPGRKIGIVDGLAASMMSAIMCVCDYVQIAENGYVMIHNPLSMVEGDSSILRRQADLLDKVRDTLTAAYQKRTGLPEQQLHQIMMEETWYNAREAMEAGLVDEIVASTKVAARLKSKFNPPPKVLKALASEKLRFGLRNIAAADGGKTKNEEEDMKIDTLDLKKKFPGADIEAIVSAIRAQEGGESDELPGTQAECEKQGLYWYEDGCHKEPKPPTAPSDAALAQMPTTPEECEQAGYYWYDDRCNVYPKSGGDVDAAEEGGVPMTQEECKNAGKYWYDDACHDSPKEGAATDAEKGGGGMTISITMARLEKEIKAAREQIRAMNRKTANQIAARVCAGSGLSDEAIHDLTHTVVRPCNFLDRSGNLDDVAYEEALRGKVSAYGGAVVDGLDGGLSAVNMNTPKNRSGYDRDYIRNLRGGKKK